MVEEQRWHQKILPHDHPEVNYESDKISSIYYASDWHVVGRGEVSSIPSRYCTGQKVLVAV
jgi:hypothetical protein